MSTVWLLYQFTFHFSDKKAKLSYKKMLPKNGKNWECGYNKYLVWETSWGTGRQCLWRITGGILQVWVALFKNCDGNGKEWGQLYRAFELSSILRRFWPQQRPLFRDSKVKHFHLSSEGRVFSLRLPDSRPGNERWALGQPRVLN